MRKRFEQQLDLIHVPIAEVHLPTKSRDELPPVLAALQYIFITPELNERVFTILEEKICGGKRKTGRPGMDLWEILVLAVSRNALDCDYDRLHHLANYDQLMRSIMGVALRGFSGKARQYKYQTLVDNVTLLDEATINRINGLVVEAGHRLVKKKEDHGLNAKADTYVLETNVHYPTDTNLLWDAGRKCLDVMRILHQQYQLPGWRKHNHWRRELKNLYRSAAQTARSGGKNKEDRVVRAVGAYLDRARELDDKVSQSIAGFAPPTVEEVGVLGLLASLDYYQQMLRKHIDLVERRLIKGEKIPHAEKVFSIFEPHSEWIAKGKAGKPAEIGHRVLIATDQHHFILHHEVVEGRSDAELAVSLARKLKIRFPQIKSLSLDKGFYSQANKEILQYLIPKVVLPKKGKLNEEEKQEESDKEFKRLKRKHSAVESNINQLEHNGLNRCPDKGLQGFKRYTALGVLSYNLHRLGNLLLEAERKKEKKTKKAAA